MNIKDRIIGLLVRVLGSSAVPDNRHESYERILKRA